MALDLVIFDCDGVLVDSESITTRTIVDALADEGLRLTRDEVLHSFRGGKMSDVLQAAEVRLGRELPEAFVPRFRERLFERLRAEIEPVPGIVAALDALTVPCCVASNGPRAKMEATLGTTGLLPRFADRIFTAYEVGSFKPEPGLFLHAAQACGAEPARCVVVEDSDNGVLAARAAGMHVVAYVGHGVAMEAPGAIRLDDMRRLPEVLADLA